MKVMFTVLYLTMGLSHSTRLCTQDHRSFSMDEVEGIVYTLASEKGVPPTVILNRILRKVRIRQRAEKTRQKNPLQEIALEELINSGPTGVGSRTRPDAPQLPPLAPQSLLPPPTNPMMEKSFYPPPQLPPPGMTMPPRQQQAGYVMTGMFVPPDFPSQMPRPMTQSFLVPFPSLNPPPGITIRVQADSSGNAFPEVTVTLSPMMTIVEALKQAESKFRSALGLSPVSDAEVISFSRSSYAQCYVIRSFDSIRSSESGYWKIIVADITGKVVYDSVCLPSRTEMAVKPGMTITLLYVVV